MKDKKIAKTLDEFNNSVKLKPDELDKVSGGGGRCYPTNYRCPICDELLYVRPKSEEFAKEYYICFNPNCFFESDTP